MEMECKLLSRIELHSGEETPRLPEQVIVEEILPRLPAKSLMKFRCVSKPWCSLIGSKRFIKAHLEYSMKSSWFAHRCIFLDYADKEFKQCGLSSLFDKPITAPISHISDLGIDKSDWIIPVGGCNGLVCILVNWKRFILWNPTTKKFKNLPNLYTLIQGSCGQIGTYGFGFDESSDDYKVFAIVSMVNLEGPPPHYIGMIYSLRNDSWKPIEDGNHVSSINGEGIGMHMSGKLHWNNYCYEIVSFDLNSHVAELVELPSYAEGILHSVRVIEGCLSAHFFHPNGDLDVWVMREYGVKESWDKVMTVPYYNRLENPVPDDIDIPAPVAIAPNGEVLLIRHSTIVIYNPKCDVLRPAFDDGFASAVCFKSMYVESLVSVAPDAQ